MVQMQELMGNHGWFLDLVLLGGGDRFDFDFDFDSVFVFGCCQSRWCAYTDNVHL